MIGAPATANASENETKAMLFVIFLSLLQRAEIPYAILSNYFDYPEYIHSDIDLVVPEPARKSILPLVQQTCNESDARLLQVSEYHNTSAWSCFIATLVDQSPVHLRLDICSDDHSRSKLLLPWEFMLAGRRRYLDKFYVPAPERSLIHYLLKRIEKKSIESQQLRAMNRWFLSVPEEAETMLARYWPLDYAEIAKSIATQTIPTKDRIERWSRNVRLADAHQTVSARGIQSVREVRRLVRRTMRPLGFMMCFMGPDGCGKTTAIALAKRALVPAFRQSAEFHLLPRLVNRVSHSNEDTSRPHDKQARGTAASVAKVFLWFVDLSFGYWLRLRPKMVRSCLVVFDRYIHDLQIDRVRYRYGGPEWWARLWAKLSPQPDLWVLLDAPAETIWKRKPELSVEEIDRQRRLYRQLLAGKPNCIVVDSAQSPDAVNAEICQEVFRRLEARTAKRFKLSAAGEA